jgi:2'-5' RNA ligase
LSRYSLWLEPPAYLALRLNALIEALALSHGGPRFNAHITLLGGLEGAEATLLDTAKALAARLEPFDVKLADVGMEDEYYRAIFLRAEKGEAFMEARRLAEEAFGLYMADGSPREFEPHLSLFYGDLEAERKEDIIRGMGGVAGTSFRVEGINLYRTGGPPHAWARIGSEIQFRV